MMVWLRRAFLASILFGLLPAYAAERVPVHVERADRAAAMQTLSAIDGRIAQPVGIDLETRTASGPRDILLRLREGKGLQLAVLRADVFQAYAAASARGYSEAAQLIAPVGLVSPLYEDDVYFLVRSDAPLNFVHEIENSRISLGPPKSGAALTAATIYGLMFGHALPAAQRRFESSEDALVKLTQNAVDVVVLVGRAPLQLLADMKPAARQYVRLLNVDPEHPATTAARKAYRDKSIPAATYPSLLSSDLQVMTIGVHLVAHDPTYRALARLGGSWCRNLAELRKSDPASPVPDPLPEAGPGWAYPPVFERTYRACAEEPAHAEPACLPEDSALGLCG